jgi:hypothetical protein
MQALEVDALLEVDLHAARCLQRALPAMARIGRIKQHIGR